MFQYYAPYSNREFVLVLVRHLHVSLSEDKFKLQYANVLRDRVTIFFANNNLLSALFCPLRRFYYSSQTNIYLN